MNLATLKKVIREFDEKSSAVAASYEAGIGKFRVTCSMLYCLLRYGARPIDYERFEFHRKSGRERSRYMTFLRYFKIARRIDSHTFHDISGNKIRELEVFADFINRDWLAVDSSTDEKTIRAFVENHPKLIAKPQHGEQGKGIFRITDDCGLERLLSERKVTPFLLEEFVENADYIKAINPSSLNTIRAYTFIDRNGHVNILTVMLRAGAPGAVVDNWGAGGVGYNFDLSTGICDQPGKDKKNRCYLHHPGSNIKMIGFNIKDFDALKDYVKRLALIMPKARFVGWDIAITPNGFELIEMNCPGGHDFLQSYGKPVYKFFIRNW